MPWYAGLRVSGGEVRSASRVALAISAAGFPVGALWLVLAPRRAYEVVDGGFAPLEPQSEALIGADGWLLILSCILGLLAAGLVWRFAAVRGVAIVLGVAFGMVVAAVLAWQVGGWLGAGPSDAQLAQIGAIVTPALQLRAIPVLVIGAFVATLGYVVLVCFAARDDLQRGGSLPASSDSMARQTAPTGPGLRGGWPAPSTPVGADVTAPPTAPPSGLRPATPDDPRS